MQHFHFFLFLTHTTTTTTAVELFTFQRERRYISMIPHNGWRRRSVKLVSKWLSVRSRRLYPKGARMSAMRMLLRMKSPLFSSQTGREIFFLCGLSGHLDRFQTKLYTSLVFTIWHKSITFDGLADLDVFGKLRSARISILFSRNRIETLLKRKKKRGGLYRRYRYIKALLCGITSKVQHSPRGSWRVIAF